MRPAGNALLVALGIAYAAPAIADPAAADAAFKRGRELLKAGKAAEACAAFEDSLRADFAYGTLWNIAECEEKIGKLGSSWAAYHRIAADDSNAARRAKAAALAEKIADRAAKLVVEVAPGPTGVAVTLDGSDVPVGESRPLDAGDHVVTVKAAGYHDGSATVTVSDGAVAHQRFELAPIPVEPTPTTPSPPPPTSTIEAPPRPVVVTAVRYTGHPTLGKAAMISGGGLIAVSVGVSLYAKHVYDGVVVNHMVVSQDPSAITKANDAAHLAGTMTYVLGLGLVVAGTGAVLWQTSTKVVTVQPQYSHDGPGVSVSGRF